MGSAASCFAKQQVQLDYDPPPLTPVSKAHVALSKVALTDATQFRADKAGYLQETFRKWDADGDGQLSHGELASMLEACGITLSQKEMQKVMTAVDLDGNGTIELEELTAWLGLSPSLTRYFDMIATLYADLEENLDDLAEDDGMEKYEEVRKQAGHDLERKLLPLIDEVFSTNDRDGNGELDEDESALLFGNFVAQLMKKPFMIKAIVGFVTCSSYEDVISEVCETAFSHKSGQKLTEAERVRLERKSRFEVQMEIVKRRSIIYENGHTQKSSFREAFKVIDANEDGCLSKEEVRECLLPSAKNDTCRKFLSALRLMATDDELKLIAAEKVMDVLKEQELASKAEQQWQKLHSTIMQAPCRRNRSKELRAPVLLLSSSAGTPAFSRAAGDAYLKPAMHQAKLQRSFSVR